MKNLFSRFFLLLSVIAAGVSTADAAVGDTWTVSVSGHTLLMRTTSEKTLFFGNYEAVIQKVQSTDITDKLVIPKTVSHKTLLISHDYTIVGIDENAMEGCKMTEIDLSAVTGLTSIGDSAFAACSGLTNINLPEGLETIGKYAFSDIITLQHVIFPSTITSIGEGAFNGDTGLKYASFENVDKDATDNSDESDKVFINSTAFPSTLYSTTRVYVPFGHEESYYNLNGLKSFTYKPIIGGGNINNILEDGLCDADLHYYYVGSANGELLNGVTTVSDGLLVCDETVTVPFNEKGTLKDYPSLEKLTGSDDYNNYSRKAWLLFKGITNKAFIGHYLAGDICFEIVDSYEGPTLQFSSGYDINRNTYEPITSLSHFTADAEAPASNIYCPANFVPQSEYYFVEPIPYEVATIKWALYQDGGFYVVKKGQGAHNDEGVKGGFTINNKWLDNSVTLTDGTVYELTAIPVKTAGATLAPALKSVTPDTDALSTSWTIYPTSATVITDVITGIDNLSGNTVEGKTIEGIRYYNAAGQSSTQPFSGLNIVVTTYTDGTATVNKQIK